MTEGLCGKQYGHDECIAHTQDYMHTICRACLEKNSHIKKVTSTHKMKKYKIKLTEVMYYSVIVMGISGEDAISKFDALMEDGKVQAYESDVTQYQVEEM